jgi:cytidylate kinase
MSDSQVIITISREYGSGGHAIAAEIAARLGLKLYDHNLLDEIAVEKGVDPEELHKYDEMPRKLFLSRSAKGTRGSHHSSAEVNIAYMQFDYLKKKAEEGKSFVVVGRCAEAVLKEYPQLISIFVLGDRETKCRRIMELYGLSEQEAYDKMKRHDVYRKRYHNNFCEDKWGDSRGYDLCVNSSVMGIDATTDMLEAYIRFRMQALDT